MDVIESTTADEVSISLIDISDSIAPSKSSATSVSFFSSIKRKSSHDGYDTYSGKSSSSSSKTVASLIVINERRQVTLTNSSSQVIFKNLPPIDPCSSLSIKSRTDTQSTLVSQCQIQPPVASLNPSTTGTLSYLAPFIGRNVTFVLDESRIQGTIISINDAIVLNNVNDTVGFTLIPPASFNRIRSIQIDETQIPMQQQSNMLWSVLAQFDSDNIGEHAVDILYHSHGISCNTQYCVNINEENDQFEFCGRYSITNDTTRTFNNASMTIRGVEESHYNQPHDPEFVMQVNEGRRFMLPANSTIEIPFAEASISPINKHYLFECSPFTFNEHLQDDQELGRRTRSATLECVLEVQNDLQQGLGIPLPRGSMVVHYIGQHPNSSITTVTNVKCTRMPATAIGEVMQIRLGPAAGLVGERRALTYKRDDSRHTITESFSITVTNHHSTPVKVVVEDRMYRWYRWTITRSSRSYHGNGDDRVRWVLSNIPVGGHETVEYTVCYSWEDSPNAPLSGPTRRHTSINPPILNTVNHSDINNTDGEQVHNPSTPGVTDDSSLAPDVVDIGSHKSPRGARDTSSSGGGLFSRIFHSSSSSHQ